MCFLQCLMCFSAILHFVIREYTLRHAKHPAMCASIQRLGIAIIRPPIKLRRIIVMRGSNSRITESIIQASAKIGYL